MEGELTVCVNKCNVEVRETRINGVSRVWNFVFYFPS